MPPALTRSKDGTLLELHLGGGRCRGSEFGDVLEKVRLIPGRSFDPDNKVWTFPADPHVAERVMLSVEPDVEDPELEEWVRAARIKVQEELTTPLPADAELLIPWATQRAEWQPEFIEIGEVREPFNGLMQHQRPAVEALVNWKRGILADDMGLGKTGVLISAVEEYLLRNPLREDGTPRTGPKLVICPASVVGSWENELELWLGPDVDYVAATGSSKKVRERQIREGIERGAWVIVNWEQIRCKRVKERLPTKNGGMRTVTKLVISEPMFAETHWIAAIADESHRAKNRKAQLTLGLWQITDAELQLEATGTPVMNRPDELWSQLAWLYPNDYHPQGRRKSPGARAFWDFFEEFTDYIENYRGKTITGVRNPEALRFELKGKLIRRTKQQVGIGTKGKRRIPVPVNLNPKQRKLYDEAEEALWLEVAQAAEEGDESARKFAEDALHARSFYRIPNGAARTVRLRQIIETPANLGAEDDSAVLDACVERIVDSHPNQWVVYCEFRPTTACLQARLLKRGLKAEVYHGDVPMEKRRQLAKDFQAGRINVLIGTISSMYQGITLTAGFNQFWCSRSWNPEINEQGEDRQDRIGQRDQVLVWIAQPRNTVATTKVAPTNRLKERIVRAIVPKDHIEEDSA